MPIDEKARSPLAHRIPAAVIFAYPRGSDEDAESGPGEVVGVLTRPAPNQAGLRKQRIHADADNEQYLWTGLDLNLHPDASESYYCNLMGEKPSVFVVSRSEQGCLQPFLVTLSYDEAASYMEVDESVSAVPMPAEIYRWCEAFVLEHYVPEKKRKRKRDNWKQDVRRP